MGCRLCLNVFFSDYTCIKHQNLSRRRFSNYSRRRFLRSLSIIHVDVFRTYSRRRFLQTLSITRNDVFFDRYNYSRRRFSNVTNYSRRRFLETFNYSRVDVLLSIFALFGYIQGTYNGIDYYVYPRIPGNILAHTRK